MVPCNVSSLGSELRPGKRPSGTSLTGITLNPNFLNISLAKPEAAPLPGSIIILRLRLKFHVLTRDSRKLRYWSIIWGTDSTAPIFSILNFPE